MRFTKKNVLVTKLHIYYHRFSRGKWPIYVHGTILNILDNRKRLVNNTSNNLFVKHSNGAANFTQSLFTSRQFLHKFQELM